MGETGQLSKLSFADRVSVVLVHPQQSLNIGSVARAMMNLGFSNLVLVNPEDYNYQKASITARWAVSLLDGAVFCGSLFEAIKDCDEVIGFGGRYDGLKFENISLPEWIDEFQPSQKIALVFGPEDRGLNTDEINMCRRLVRIPSSADYASYNLAQSVLLALYELSRTEWNKGVLKRDERELPTWNDFFQLDRLLEEALVVSGFYRDGTPAPIPGVVQRLFRRMAPDKREMGILLAMVSRLRKAIKE